MLWIAIELGSHHDWHAEIKLTRTRRSPPDFCESWWLIHVQSSFGGTTEIMKEIIGRSLGLWV